MSGYAGMEGLWLFLHAGVLGGIFLELLGVLWLLRRIDIGVRGRGASAGVSKASGGPLGGGRG